MRLLEAARRHPVITTFFAVCTLAGSALGLALLDPDWSAARRIAVGGLGGIGVGLLVTATRLFD